jgi:hypothetical protein
MVAILRKVYEKEPTQDWSGLFHSNETYNSIIPSDILEEGRALLKEYCDTIQGFGSTKTYFLGVNFYVREFIFDSFDNAMLAVQNDHVIKRKTVSTYLRNKLLERNIEIPIYKSLRHVIIENDVYTYINDDKSINNDEQNTSKKNLTSTIV